MSLAQETYISPPIHTAAASVMDLRNLLQTRQVYDGYHPSAEASQQAQQSPQLQLPPQPMIGEPQVVSTVHEGRLYRYDSPSP